MRRLDLLRGLYGRVLIAPVVKKEVVDQGKAISAPGVERVEDALEKRWLQVVRLTAKERSLVQRLLKNSRVHEGEAESLSVARRRNLGLIVDDKEARAWAAMLGIAFLGTAAVFLEACLRDHLPLPEFEEVVRDLTKVLWLSPAVVTEVLRVAREAKT